MSLTETDFRARFPNASDDVVEANIRAGVIHSEHSARTTASVPPAHKCKPLTAERAAGKLSAKKRIRQSAKPLLNKLETEWLAVLADQYPDAEIHPQAWRVKIGNGAWFKVDFCACIEGRWIAWEVKGNKGKNIDRGKLALKVAASKWREVQWFFVWKVGACWNMQEVLP